MHITEVHRRSNNEIKMRHCKSHLHSLRPLLTLQNQDKLSYYAGVISSPNANIRALTMLAALKAELRQLFILRSSSHYLYLNFSDLLPSLWNCHKSKLDRDSLPSLVIFHVQRSSRKAIRKAIRWKHKPGRPFAISLC